ncbi:MAG TPA: phosphoglycerate mutase family protein, partial [bacterium]
KRHTQESQREMTMKTIGAFVIGMSIMTIQAATGIAQPTIYIVRHAEALEPWPGDSLADYKPLNSEGVARSQKLAERFSPGSLTAIYTSLTTRTIQTAHPLAQKLGLSIKIADACMDTAAVETFYGELEAQYGDEDVILLVTHSNIIPELLMAAALPPECYVRMGFVKSPHYPGWLIEGYDNLWKIQWRSRDNACKGIEKTRF